MTTSPLIHSSRNLLLPAALALTLLASSCGSDAGSEPSGDPNPTSAVADDDSVSSDDPIPVEPDGGIGDGAEPLPTLDGGPIPVEPDGGIGDGAGPPAEPVGADVIFNVTWTLTRAEIDGEAVELDPMYPVTLVIEHEDVSVDPTRLNISGTAACNGYFGQVFFDGGTIFEPSGLGQTEMACEPPVMAIEAAYTGAMSTTDAIEIGDGAITLTGPTSTLTFEVQ